MALSSNTSKKRGVSSRLEGAYVVVPAQGRKLTGAVGLKLVHTTQTDLPKSHGRRRVAAPGSMYAPPPSRASFGLGPQCPVPGPGGKPRSPGSAPCLAGFPNASCANQHRSSSLEMLFSYLSQAQLMVLGHYQQAGLFSFPSV